MKKDGQKIEDPASETPIEMCDRILRQMKTYILLSLLIAGALVYVAAYHDNKISSVLPTCEQRVLTLSSPIRVKRADGKIIDMSLSEFADYAIQQHWQNTMTEEEARP